MALLYIMNYRTDIKYEENEIHVSIEQQCPFKSFISV